MSILAGIFRTILLWVYVAGYLTHTTIGGYLIADIKRRRHFYALATSFWTGCGLRMLGIHLHVTGRENAASEQVLVVPNHLSYLDILIISSIYPSLFITSVEVEKTFFLGRMSRLGGSIFVERRNRARLRQDIEQVSQAIVGGNRTVLFPEGTTGNGDSILPFKASMFAVTELAPIAVQPICIKYRKLNGRPVDKSNRDRLYYYGDISFFPHFFGLPWLGNVDVDISFLPTIEPLEGRTRKELSEICRNRIIEAYQA